MENANGKINYLNAYADLVIGMNNELREFYKRSGGKPLDELVYIDNPYSPSRINTEYGYIYAVGNLFPSEGGNCFVMTSEGSYYLGELNMFDASRVIDLIRSLTDGEVAEMQERYKDFETPMAY